MKARPPGRMKQLSDCDRGVSMKCARCGTDNKDSSVFCRECGKSLATDVKKGPENAVIDGTKEKRRIGLYVLVGCLAGALLVAAVISLAMVGRDNSGKKSMLQSADEVIKGVTGLTKSGSADGDNSKPQKHTLPAPAHAKGEPVRSGTFTVNVDGSEFSEGESIQRPAEGRRFLVVDVAVKNEGARAADVSSMLQMVAVDGAGNQYGTSLYFPSPRYPDGTIQPGGTAKGKVVFEVPARRKDFYFVFDPGVLTDAGEVGVSLY